MELTQEQLQEILDKHKRWLNDEEGGECADLKDFNLTGANLAGANLTEANLTEAKLTGAKLTQAKLTDVDLTDADLTGAKLIGAKLTGADLTRANLIGANLTGANLRGSTLNWALVSLTPDNQIALFNAWKDELGPSAIIRQERRAEEDGLKKRSIRRTDC